MVITKPTLTSGGLQKDKTINGQATRCSYNHNILILKLLNIGLKFCQSFSGVRGIVLGSVRIGMNLVGVLRVHLVVILTSG